MRAHLLVVAEFLLLGAPYLQASRKHRWNVLLTLIMVAIAAMGAAIGMGTQTLLRASSFEFSARRHFG